MRLSCIVHGWRDSASSKLTPELADHLREELIFVFNHPHLLHAMKFDHLLSGLRISYRLIKEIVDKLITESIPEKFEPNTAAYKQDVISWWIDICKSINSVLGINTSPDLQNANIRNIGVLSNHYKCVIKLPDDSPRYSQYHIFEVLKCAFFEKLKKFGLTVYKYELIYTPPCTLLLRLKEVMLSQVLLVKMKPNPLTTDFTLKLILDTSDKTQLRQAACEFHTNTFSENPFLQIIKAFKQFTTVSLQLRTLDVAAGRLKLPGEFTTRFNLNTSSCLSGLISNPNITYESVDSVLTSDYELRARIDEQFKQDKNILSPQAKIALNSLSPVQNICVRLLVAQGVLNPHYHFLIMLTEYLREEAGVAEQKHFSLKKSKHVFSLILAEQTSDRRPRLVCSTKIRNYVNIETDIPCLIPTDDTVPILTVTTTLLLPTEETLSRPFFEKETVSISIQINPKAEQCFYEACFELDTHKDTDIKPGSRYTLTLIDAVNNQLKESGLKASAAAPIAGHTEETKLRQCAYTHLRLVKHPSQQEVPSLTSIPINGK